MEQLTEEWQKERVGKVTASRMSDVLAVLKSGGEAALRKNYRAELVAERKTKRKTEKFQSKEMLWGIEKEPEAKAAFSFDTNIDIEDVGFINHPTIPMAGASPDGFTSDGGLIEVKCPNTATHIDYILKDRVPIEYQPQMAWQMACTGRPFCWFVSYDPRLIPEPESDEEDLSLFYKRFDRDEKLIKETSIEVIKFLSEVDADINKLKKIRLRRK